ncbi:Enamine deaminase RidA, house cleaning of reactive enamine intermediates, YjgF/YER057c/UK114 family [Sphingobium sp. AP50]|uniref:RidA family protein n=1 Tax=Sphingobium sp. AP50 TaxID=1884369 RepID=UPI0008AB2D95|nr:RidA family protein [Sphingobium sp. AP50]SEJ65698.1 Enamine deaminase RidA, house cleaning of reactive enamine intermediates, YjgF/YER057c/UK114 family [Sphingobium sp. AP50]
MTSKIAIVPPVMQEIVERAGYLPAVQAGDFLFCAGQVGRDDELAVIADPEQQFERCWENLRTVLAEGGCSFDDVVEMTTFHVGLQTHMPLFRQVKDRHFPRGTCAWTCVGVVELAIPGLLAEVKCVAIKQPTHATR